jgi:hypothetical protein
MREAMQKAVEEELDRIDDLLERSAQGWIGDLPGPDTKAAYIAALNAARHNIEEALRIVENADRT